MPITTTASPPRVIYLVFPGDGPHGVGVDRFVTGKYECGERDNH